MICHLLIYFSPNTASTSPELVEIWKIIARKASNGTVREESVEQLLTDPSMLRRRIEEYRVQAEGK